MNTIASLWYVWLAGLVISLFFTIPTFSSIINQASKIDVLDKGIPWLFKTMAKFALMAIFAWMLILSMIVLLIDYAMRV